MSQEAAWIDSVRALATAHGALASLDRGACRRALCELDRVMRSAPAPIAMRYAAIPEEALRSAAEMALGVLDEHLSWPAGYGDIVMEAAVQARVLDEHLLTHGRAAHGPPADANSDYLCIEEAMHAVPRHRVSLPPVGTLDAQPYSRRGVRFHRLIPQEADGFAIDLKWYPDLAIGGLNIEGTRLGAAFFSGMTLTRRPHDPTNIFVAADAPCADEAGDLQHHVDGAFARDCLAAVWPELSMPEGRRERLVKALRAAADDHTPGTGPSLVVPGSWHEPGGKGIRNVTRVLSRMGRERFQVHKTVPFESKGVKESIEPSFSIPVLMNEDVLIAFGICRDFCEARLTKVFRQLPVDLVVVPSYGNERTILGHRAQAEAISLDHDVRTFVVQHAHPAGEAGEGVGFVVPPVRAPSKLSPVDMLEPGPFSVHEVEFKAC